MKEHYLRRQSITILSCICFLLIGVRADGQSMPFREELTVKRAATLLKSHEMFEKPWVIQLRTGEIPASISDIEHYQPQYVTFRALGWIEISTSNLESSEPQTTRSTDKTLIALTEKGKSESKSWKQIRENEWEIAIATREIVEIIKIHFDKEIPVGIEFSWTYLPNKMGEALQFTYQTEKAYARLQLLDDGWKIIKIRALSS